MNENNIVLENTSLFLNLDYGISQLADAITHFERNDLLMVALCEDAMPVANRIARSLGLNLTFSSVDLNTKTADSADKGIPVEFDYGMVKESGRDIPQDFIVHQEQNLRTSLISIYTETYKNLIKAYPGKVVILLDQLKNINAALFPCLTHNADESGGSNFSTSPIRQFVFMHLRMAISGKTAIHSLDMIIEHSS